MTVRVRLTLYWAGVLSLLLLGAAVAVFLLFQRQQWGRLDGALMEEADTAAQTIAHGADVPQMVARLIEVRTLSPTRRLWVVGGAVTLASAGHPGAAVAAAALRRAVGPDIELHRKRARIRRGHRVGAGGEQQASGSRPGGRSESNHP